jgi:hypothetical protein
MRKGGDASGDTNCSSDRATGLDAFACAKCVQVPEPGRTELAKKNDFVRGVLVATENGKTVRPTTKIAMLSFPLVGAAP